MSGILDIPLPPPSSAYVGRAVAMAEAESVLEAARRGRGGLVLITGESGIGKTTLASRMSDRAVVNDMAAYWSACSLQAAVAPPYWTWWRLLEDCLARTDEVDRAELTRIVEPVLATMGPSAAPPVPVGSPAPVLVDQFTLFQTVVRFWTLAAHRRPIVLVIDDLQWANPASIEMLAYLSTELRQLPVALVATLRTGEPIGEPMANALSALDVCGPLVLQLRGLSTGDVAELMDAGGVATHSAMADLLYQRSGGNPFLATELLRMLDPGADGTTSLEALATEIPGHVDRVLRRRVAELEPTLRELLQAASVIGPTGQTSVLAVVAGVDLDTCRAVLAEAVDGGMLVHDGADRWRFSNTLLLDVVRSALPVASRRRLDERAIDALAAAEPSLPVSTTPSGELDHAIESMIEMGREHLSRREFDAAADCFARAVDLDQARGGPASGARCRGTSIASASARSRSGSTRSA